jgi:ankyrin repeat protein
MGNTESRQQSYFLEAILCGRDGTCARMLKETPKLAQCTFYNGTTNPVCRATYLNQRNIVILLMKYGGDVNHKSSNLRTPLHWAAWMDLTDMIELLLQHTPDLKAEDKDGWTSLDLAILRINFKAAKKL